MMREVLQFLPLYQERVWGGRRLESFLGRELPGKTPIGEAWEIVDRPEAQSRVAGGRHKGLSLRELIERFARDLGSKVAGRSTLPASGQVAGLLRAPEPS